MKLLRAGNLDRPVETRNADLAVYWAAEVNVGVILLEKAMMMSYDLHFVRNGIYLLAE